MEKIAGEGLYSGVEKKPGEQTGTLVFSTVWLKQLT